jgi:hypothetical protein
MVGCAQSDHARPYTKTVWIVHPQVALVSAVLALELTMVSAGTAPSFLWGMSWKACGMEDWLEQNWALVYMLLSCLWRYGDCGTIRWGAESCQVMTQTEWVSKQKAMWQGSLAAVQMLTRSEVGLALCCGDPSRNILRRQDRWFLRRQILSPAWWPHSALASHK